MTILAPTSLATLEALETAAYASPASISGAWVASALAMQPQAEAARIGIARNAEITDRDALARRLLVGMEI
jgi:hypothetical protein